jgi:7-cyano-7-deazaguanine synthase in queuosine biosynthesis
LVSREIDGFQKWSRHFILHAPVHNVSEWEKIKSDFESLLGFLSGDKWEIIFREHTERVALQERIFSNPKGIEIVSLFSGGLDSYIGAIDLLEKGRKVVLISHYKGGTAEKTAQDVLFKNFQDIYKKIPPLHYQIYVQPNQNHKLAVKEGSSRCRSLVFMVLGIAVANSLGDNIDVNVPENGFISLNVPLTPTRLSSHSTRTTHPYYMSLFNKIIHSLGIKSTLINPYQFQTKGEMFLSCMNLDLLQSQYKLTMSCAHPDLSRFIKDTSPGKPCGYCTPCIIRRSALKKAELKESGYTINVLKNPPDPSTKTGRDLRAFKLSIERFKKLKPFPLLMHILSSGPIPFEDKDSLDKFVSIYSRGLKEVSDFLESN